jgi:hypothetical protein
LDALTRTPGGIMKINDLRAEIPFEWRIQQSKQNGCMCVAYITARQAMDALDAICGPENWQDKYYEVQGKVYCAVGIKAGDQWVWKSDCGTEPPAKGMQQENAVDIKEKGQASDAFKRACVKWGLGRFLYNLDMIWLPTMQGSRDQKHHPIHDVEKLGEVPPKYVLYNQGKPTLFLNERLISEYITEVVIPRRQK